MKNATKILMRMILVLSATLGTGEVLAHHSFAMFDKTKYMTVEGTVLKIEWANPHAYLQVQVPGSNGTSVIYAIECSSPNELSRWGWKYNSVKVGDHISVGIYPLRNGQPGGLLFSVTLANGTVFKGN